MRAYIYEAEWWPVYTVTEDDGVPHLGRVHEVPLQLLDRYRAAEDQFNAVQQELAELVASAP